MKRVALAVALLIGLATPSQADYRDGLDACMAAQVAASSPCVLSGRAT